MLFRAGLPPYDTVQAEARFDALLDQLTERLGDDDADHKARRARRWIRSAFAAAAFWRSAAWLMFVGRFRLAVRGVPEEAHGSVSHPSDDGSFPRLSEWTPADRVALVRARLRHQRLWHLRKAGRYYSWYLLFPGLTQRFVGCSTGPNVER